MKFATVNESIGLAHSRLLNENLHTIEIEQTVFVYIKKRSIQSFWIFLCFQLHFLFQDFAFSFPDFLNLKYKIDVATNNQRASSCLIIHLFHLFRLFAQVLRWCFVFSFADRK